MPAFLLVLTTASSRSEALKLTDRLLSLRLAACVSISAPVESHYHWKGKRTQGKEVQLWIKTRAANYQKIEKTLKKYHSYSVPEVIAMPILKGSRDYLGWIRKET